MIKPAQQIDLNMTLPSEVKNIFLLYDNVYNVIDTMIIEGKSNHQVIFDEAVIFISDIESSIDEYLEDFDKKNIFTIHNRESYPFEFSYKNSYLTISYNQSKYFKFFIKDDNFEFCDVEI